MLKDIKRYHYLIHGHRKLRPGMFSWNEGVSDARSSTMALTSGFLVTLVLRSIVMPKRTMMLLMRLLHCVASLA